MWTTLLIAALATLLLISGKVRADIVGLLVALSLAYTGILPLDKALAGFSSNVVFIIIAIFILTKGLETSGVTAMMGERLGHLARGSERRLVVVTMLAAAVLSLFMNTVAAAAVLLPPVLAISRQSKNISPSRVLIPLAYGTLLGGTATLLTTANLVTSASLAAHGYQPYGLLDFLPVGLPVTIAGLVYMVFVGRRLLPRYEDAHAPRASFADLMEAYRLREGLHPLEVAPNSPLVGRLARKPHLARESGLTPVGLVTPRGVRFAHQLPPERRLLPGDVLLVAGNIQQADLEALGLHPLSDENICDDFREHATLAELTLNPRGDAVGKTPQELRLYARYGMRVLAIWRHGEILDTNLQAVSLQKGDALLVQLPPEGLEQLRNAPDFVILETFGGARARPSWQAVAAVGLLLLALVPAALGWLPLALSALSAATLMMLLGIVPPDQAYQAISWRVIFLIAGMIPLGVAMRDTGAAAFLSQQMLKPLAHSPAWIVAAAFLLLTTMLAQITSGQVAALIVAPLAIAAAEAQGIDPRGLGMAVAVGASFAFLLPTGHPVNLLVMGPGHYKPSDYFKVGLLLLLIVVPVAVLAIQIFWL